MQSTFLGLETSKRGILTQRVALNTLGHNISNASTEGYSRQRVNMTSSIPMEALGLQRSNTPGQLGTGVEYSHIERVRDSYLDLQYRRENQSLAMWTTHESAIHSIEALINEPSGNGLSSVMDKFWNSLEVLNRDPGLLSARIDVVGSAVNMVDTMKGIGTGLDSIEFDVANNIDKKVSQANILIEGIAELNVLIRRTEAFGDNANDYRDQRDLMIDKLSTIVDVQVAETPAGDFSITAAGVNVVNNEATVLLTAANATVATAGELAGYQKALGEVELIRNQLNAMVNTLVQGSFTVRLENGYMTSGPMTAQNNVTLEGGAVILAGVTIPAGSKIISAVEFEVQGFNGLHELGYGLPDGTTGVPFFTTADGSTTFNIDNIRVNPVVQNDTNKIAASGQYELDGTNRVTIKGNSDIAHALASLRDHAFTYPGNLTSLSSGTTDDYFRALTGDLGIRSNNANRNMENLENLTDQINIRRQSVSGVSLDEEMADLIRFQHAYNAAARNLTAVDEMLDRVINQMGIVGR